MGLIKLVLSPNKLEIEAVNLWGNRLIGDESYEDDGIVDGKWPNWLLNGEERPSKRSTFTSWKHYSKEKTYKQID